MAKEAQLTDEEKGSIAAFHLVGMSNRAIAKTMGRSKDVVRNYILDPQGYGTRCRGMPRRILVDRDCRLLLREACKTGSSARVLKTTLNLEGSLRTCQRRLQACGRLKFEKRKHTPRLTPKHKEARLEYAMRNLSESTNWTKVIWSDEKKFNLDGPDGFQYYWHDLRKESDTFLTRQKGGAGVMVWGAFSGAGLSELAFLEGTQNSDKYVETISNFMLPFGHQHYGENMVFMQDGASIHRSKMSLEFFKEQHVELFSHPALSPDLNPIENLWGLLARVVYANGRQFMTKEELISAIKRAWNSLSQSYLNKLIASMPKRCSEVVLARGDKTKY
ncbi:hypothetical protein AaE_012460 [Aphanomyces astaci]|uniref:Tc1-like transposase DDE domain-containing protein n=1 Tax=Aphanomyces astaci TaxID=112090 RepID=A0A6A4ZHZ3_APHAT|nr:hypothetical protein AaE_012460 [Aphanomyces astaci]